MNVAHLVASEEEISHVVESQSSEGEVLNPADLALDVIFDLNEELVPASRRSHRVEIERAA